MADEILKKELEEVKKEVAKYKNIILKGKVNDYIFESLYNGGKINVCGLNGVVTKIPVTHLTSVLDVKKALERKKGVPAEKCHLCFGGSRGSSTLENHRSLFYYKICIGSTIHVVMQTEASHVSIVNEEHDKEVAFDGYDIHKAEQRLVEKINFQNMYGENPKPRKGWTGKVES